MVDDSHVKGIALALLVSTLYLLASPVRVTAQPYEYTVNAVWNEFSGVHTLNGCYVTAYFSGGSLETFEVNGSTIKSWGSRPLYLRYNLVVGYREYWAGADSGASTDLFVFNTTNLNVYSFSLLDELGVTSQAQYFDSRILINDTWVVSERKYLEEAGETSFLMAYGNTYRMVLHNGDDIEYVLGDFIAGTDLTQTMYVRAINFPRMYILVYSYVLCYASRTETTVTVDYNDTLSGTQDGTVSIYFKNGTLATAPLSITANETQINWNLADNETDYYVHVDVNHSILGTLHFARPLPHGFTPPNPWGLSPLGNITGLETANLIPFFAILSVTFIFSSINIGFGVFAVVCMLGVFIALGWIDMSTTTITVLFVLVILFSLGLYKRRATNL